MKANTLRTLALTSAFALASCAGGPERTPRQPVPGVDSETNETDNPHDLPANGSTTGRLEHEGEGHDRPNTLVGSEHDSAKAAEQGGPEAPRASTGGSFLDAFLSEVEAAHAKQPGVVAVFPALTTIQETGAPYVDALGERLADEAVSGLELRGVEPMLGGATLRDEILASNRSISTMTSVSEALALGDRMQATYAIYGTVRKRVLRRMSKDFELDVQYVCRHLPTRKTIAAFRPKLGGRDALTADFSRYVGRKSQAWSDVGDPAALVAKPSLQGEVRWIAKGLARRLASRHAPLMSGKSVRVPATLLTTTAPNAAKLRDWTTQFSAKLAEAERAVGDGESGDAEARALAKGPVTIDGQTFDTFQDALGHYRTQRSAAQTSAGGQLASDLAAGFREALASEVNLKVLNADSDKESLLNVIRREMRQYRSDASVDAATVAMLEAQGTEVLIETTLRKEIGSYVLRATVHDLSNNRKVSESLPFDARFNAELDNRLGR